MGLFLTGSLGFSVLTLEFSLFPLIFSLLGFGLGFFTSLIFLAFLSPPITFSMADDVPQGGAPSVILEGGVPLADPEVPILLPAADVEDPMSEDADIVVGYIPANITAEEI